MSYTLLFGLVALLMAYRLLDVHTGDHYVCPRCGARNAEDHDGDCPWHR